MKDTLTAYAVVRGDEVELIFPYCAELIDRLKTIPSRWRSWNPRTRRWTIYSPYTEPSIRLVGDFFDVERVAPVGAAPTTHDDRGCLQRVVERWPEYAELGLLPGAPPELVRASYRILSRERHPDAGGTHEAMVRLNHAYEKLKS